MLFCSILTAVYNKTCQSSYAFYLMNKQYFMWQWLNELNEVSLQVRSGKNNCWFNLKYSTWLS